MKFNKIMLMLLLFVLLLAIVPVYADIEVRTYDASLDFSVSTNQNVNVCACSSSIDYLTVTNTGSFTALFFLTSEMQLSENNFELRSGESRQVSIYTQLDCNPRTKTYTITVKSNLGVEKTYEKQINSERCQNLELRFKPTTEIKACENADYTIFLKNTGEFPEDYSIKSNLDKYMTYSSDKFTLLQGQTAVVNATLSLPCEINGQKNVEFTAYAIKNKLDATISSVLTIFPDYAFDVYVNKEYNDNSSYRQVLGVCNRVWNTEFPITIKNNGIENTFTVLLNNFPEFASIKGIDDNNYKFSLARGESKTFYVSVDSHDFREEIKGYDFSITLRPTVGSAVDKKLRINLAPCYEHTVSINDISSEKKPIDTCAEGFYEYDINIKNNGVFAENMKLSVNDAPFGVELSKYNINVKPEDSETVKLYIIGPETNYKYNIKIYAELNNQIVESDNIWIQAHDTQACHNIEFDKSNYKINYDNKYIDIPAKNLGLYADYYDLNLDYDLLEYTPSGDTSSDDNLLDYASFLSLQENHVYINDSTNIRLNVDSKDMPEGIYSIKLIAEHITGASYSNDLTITLKDKTAIRKAFEYFFFGSQCRQVSFWQIVAILLVCILIIIFMIIGPHYLYKLSNRIKQKLPILIVLIAIFIIALILVIVLADRPKTNNEIYGLNTSLQDLRFETVENSDYSLDAGQFFSDPDKNTLRYDISKIKDVNSVVNDNMIILKPDFGWHGKRTFTITAYDNQGGVIESPEMTLVVLDVPKKSMLELYNVYCWYTNLLILLILLFLIFLAFIVKQKRRGRK